MKLIIFILSLLLIAGVTNNTRTLKLEAPISTVRTGSVKFYAEIVSREGERLVVKNISTGEIINATSAISTNGKQGNIILNLNGGYPNVIAWSQIRNQGSPIGAICEVSGSYAKVNDRWYRIADINAIGKNAELIDKQAYAVGDRIEKVEL